MIVYYVFATVILLIQAVVLVEAYRNLIYTRRQYRPTPSKYQPRTAVISPCKGMDTTFDRNINSLFHLNYPDYEIFFVVDSATDPAYRRITEIIEQNSANSHPVKAHLVIAGPAQTSSQKVHNLLTVCNSLPSDFEVLAFIDSDACLKSHFLTSLVHPLRRKDVGASTGYRWFVPVDNRIGSAVLSAINAFFASQMGPHSWVSTWGGAMALQRKTYDQINLSQVWRNCCTDDYPLTTAVHKADLLVIFAPACYVASYEKTSWRDLFSFARRQFIITRVYMHRLWVLAILGMGHFVVAFWTGLLVSLYLYANSSVHARYAAMLPVFLMVASIVKALFRQIMIRKILPEDRYRLLVPALIDIFLQPFLAVFTLACLISSAFSRVIVWRGIRYTLHSANHTEIADLSTNT